MLLSKTPDDRNLELDLKLDQILAELSNISSVFDSDESSSISDENAQKLFVLATKIYLMKIYENPKLLPFGGDKSVTATDVSILATKMLKEADIAIFELAMWQSFGRD